jgi:zinc transport system substrate-binding protein
LNVRIGVLDPLGAELTPGPELYFVLLGRLANALATCLRP